MGERKGKGRRCSTYGEPVLEGMEDIGRYLLRWPTGLARYGPVRSAQAPVLEGALEAVHRHKEVIENSDRKRYIHLGLPDLVVDDGGLLVGDVLVRGDGVKREAKGQLGRAAVVAFEYG